MPSAVSADRRRPIRIGALTQSWGPSPGMVGLRDALLELGYREPEDFVIGIRFTQGDVTALPAAARELVAQGVDLLVADQSDAARAARGAGSRVPILVVGAADLVSEGLVQSYAKPGGNVTGVASRELELAPKRLELFRDCGADFSPV